VLLQDHLFTVPVSFRAVPNRTMDKEISFLVRIQTYKMLNEKARDRMEWTFGLADQGRTNPLDDLKLILPLIFRAFHIDVPFIFCRSKCCTSHTILYDVHITRILNTMHDRQSLCCFDVRLQPFIPSRRFHKPLSISSTSQAPAQYFTPHLSPPSFVILLSRPRPLLQRTISRVPRRTTGQ